MATFLLFTNGGNDWGGRPFIVKRGSVWIMIWRESTAHELGGSTFNINFSTNEGTSWTANNVFTDAVAVTGFPYSHTAATADQSDDAELVLCPNGDLLFISHERKNVAPPNDWVTNWQHRSTDGGKTWTSDGDLNTLLPDTPDPIKFWAFYDYTTAGSDLYIVCAQYATDFDDSRVCLWKSSNNGASYTKVSDIFAIGDTSPDPNECGIIHVGSGRMIAISRTRNLNKTIKRESLDYGATWGSITDVSSYLGGDGVHQPKLEYLDGTSRIFLSGRAYRNSSNWINAFWYSDDNCETWTPVLLETVGLTDAGYTKLLMKADGSLFGVGYRGSLIAASMYKFLIDKNT